ncbi:hypothetical protein Pmar_PMAR023120, partial [Perkinsus marinus ATCC 50983]
MADIRRSKRSNLPLHEWATPQWSKFLLFYNRKKKLKFARESRTLAPQWCPCEMSWLSYTHPDPYVACCMRTDMLFGSLSKYWSLEKDAPREHRNYRGKRQAGLTVL